MAIAPENMDQHDCLASPEPIGEMTSDQRSTETADSISSYGEAGLRGRIAPSGHVNREERQHESAELVQERAQEKNPRPAGKRAQVFFEASFCFVHKFTKSLKRYIVQP